MAWISQFFSYITGNSTQQPEATTATSLPNDKTASSTAPERELQSIASSTNSGNQSLGIENRGLDYIDEEQEQDEPYQDQPILSFSRLTNSIETRRISRVAEKDHWFTPPLRRAGPFNVREPVSIPTGRDPSSGNKGFMKPKRKKSLEYTTVEIKRGRKDELGFKIEGGVDSPIIPGDPGIFVQFVVPKGPAYTKLYPGDRILSVNDINVSHVTRREAKEIISNTTGSVVTFYVKRATRRQLTIQSILCGENAKDNFFTKEQLEEKIKEICLENQIEITYFVSDWNTISEFDDAFSLFSKDASGTIKISKIFNLIRSLGHNPAEHVVWVYLNELGLTANSKLSFYDFVELMTVIVGEQNQESELASASNVFDTEERGFVTVKELNDAFKRMPGRERMLDSELKEIMTKADPTKRGIIRLKDFETLLQPSITLY